MDAERKAQAIREIRRRLETAADWRQRAKLLVLQRAIESEMSFETVGQVVDEVGNVFGYVFALFKADPEIVSDPTTYIWVGLIRESVEAFARYAERANQGVELDQHQKQACIDLICAYLGIGG